MTLNIFFYILIFIVLAYFIFQVSDFIFSKTVDKLLEKIFKRNIWDDTNKEGEAEWYVLVVYLLFIAFSMWGSYKVLTINGLTTELKWPEFFQKKIEEQTKKSKVMQVTVVDVHKNPVPNAEVKILRGSSSPIQVKLTNERGIVNFDNLNEYPTAYIAQKNCKKTEGTFTNLDADFSKNDIVTFEFEIKGFDTSVRIANKTSYFLNIMNSSSSDCKTSVGSPDMFIPPPTRIINDDYGQGEKRFYKSAGSYTFNIKQNSECDSDAMFFGKCKDVCVSFTLSECENLTIYVSMEDNQLKYEFK